MWSRTPAGLATGIATVAEGLARRHRRPEHGVDVGVGRGQVPQPRGEGLWQRLGGQDQPGEAVGGLGGERGQTDGLEQAEPFF